MTKENNSAVPGETLSVRSGSARRAQLLDIAAQLFATRGYSSTTVRDIADEAGILSGSLYHHFDSKETMLREILSDFMERLTQRSREIVEEPSSPGETLDNLVRWSFLCIHECPHQVALYQNEVALVAHLPGFEFATKTSRGIEGMWLQVLADGQKSGEFRNDLDRRVIYRFMRDTIWVTVRWYEPAGRLRHDKVADQFLTMLHGGLLAR